MLREGRNAALILSLPGCELRGQGPGARLWVGVFLQEERLPLPAGPGHLPSILPCGCLPKALVLGSRPFLATGVACGFLAAPARDASSPGRACTRGLWGLGGEGSSSRVEGCPPRGTRGPGPGLQRLPLGFSWRAATGGLFTLHHRRMTAGTVGVHYRDHELLEVI